MYCNTVIPFISRVSLHASCLPWPRGRTAHSVWLVTQRTEMNAKEKYVNFLSGMFQGCISIPLFYKGILGPQSAKVQMLRELVSGWSTLKFRAQIMLSFKCGF